MVWRCCGFWALQLIGYGLPLKGLSALVLDSRGEGLNAIFNLFNRTSGSWTHESVSDVRLREFERDSGLQDFTWGQKR